MTIVAAIKEPGANRVWIGSDTQSTYNERRCYSGPKWVLAHGWALGISGYHRAINLAAAHRDALFADLASPEVFLQRWAKVLAGESWNSDARAGPKDYGCDYLLVRPDVIYDIDCAFAITPTKDGELCAVGNGTKAALGCAFGLTGIAAPQVILRRSVEAACAIMEGCGGEPYYDVMQEAQQREPVMAVAG